MDRARRGLPDHARPRPDRRTCAAVRPGARVVLPARLDGVAPECLSGPGLREHEGGAVRRRRADLLLRGDLRRLAASRPQPVPDRAPRGDGAERAAVSVPAGHGRRAAGVERPVLDHHAGVSNRPRPCQRGWALDRDLFPAIRGPAGAPCADRADHAGCRDHDDRGRIARAGCRVRRRADRPARTERDEPAGPAQVRCRRGNVRAAGDRRAAGRTELDDRARAVDDRRQRQRPI